MSVLRIPENTPEWDRIRLDHVGGSEIAALFGVAMNYQMSHFTLHQVKARKILPPRVDDAPGSRIWFGRNLEAVIARMSAALYGWDIEKGGYCRDDTTPGMGCSLDYVIREPGPEETKLGFHGPGVLQLKNTDWLAHKREWVQAEPPYAILLQLQHEMACSGYGWGVIGCLIGGNELPVYRYAASEKIASAIRARVADFWADVRAGKPPNIDKSESTAEALRALYPSIASPVPVDMRAVTDFAPVCAQFQVTKANKAASDEAYRHARNELEGLLQGETMAESDEYRVSVAVTPPRGGRIERRRIQVTEIFRK